MSDKELSLDHITPAGSYIYTDANALCLSDLIQIIKSDKTKTLERIYQTGNLVLPIEDFHSLFESSDAHCLVKGTDFSERVYTWGHTFLSVLYNKKSKGVTVSGYATDPALCKSIKEWNEKYISKVKKNMIFSIVSTSSGLTLKNMGDASSELIESNYNEEVIAGMNHIFSSFEKSPPNGRIAILDGEPGTGKTHLIRSMLSKLDSIFIIVPSNMVESLDKPDFIPLLLNARDDYEKPIIMIIEDGDICLVPRKSDNISIVSSLLNLSDGILGAILDIKLVISTNAHIKDMDEAIMRPGRLCKQVHVGPLSFEQANKVYQRLMKDNQAKLAQSRAYTLAEVYSIFNNKDVEVPAVVPVQTKRPIGFISQSREQEYLTLNKLETEK